MNNRSGQNMNMRTEAELVEAARNGEVEDFGELYRRHYAAVVAVAYCVVADRQTAAQQRDGRPGTMSDTQPKKLDELLRDAVELRPWPDFAKWRHEHAQAVDALRALPRIIVDRRSTMIRIARYGTSAAAVLLFLAAGAWWMLFIDGARNAWAEAMDRLAQVHSATCSLHTHHSGFAEVSKTYLEGSRVRVEDPNRFYIIDFLEGKMVQAETSSRTAMIVDLKKEPDGLVVLGSNPLNDLIQMRNAPAERLPDEQVGETLCQVYRVKDTAFMGYRVPWVKLWLDPRSKFPVQIHSVVAESRDMTFNDFHWNEPFDRSLLELLVPEGYELVVAPGSERTSEAATSTRAGAVAPNEIDSAKVGGSAEAGREIPTDEIAKTLDMLGQRIEANYKAMNSWSGTLDVTERYRHTRDPQYEQISHAAVEFFAEPGRDRIRINNRAVEPVRIISDAGVTPGCELPESRWVRTPEELLRFPVSELRHTVEGFPRIEGFRLGKGFRVLYREPPKAVDQYTFQGYIDPLSFFGSGQPNWDMSSMLAGALRGDRGPEDMEYAKRNITLRVRQKGTGKEYVLTQRLKPVGSGQILEWVFSSEAGFNVVSREFRDKGQPSQSQQYHFRKDKGVFIPHKVEVNRYENRRTKQSRRLPTQHRVYTLKQTQVNEPIDPAVFEIRSLGLQYGDRLADWIENRMYVFDGKTFVPADKFKLQPAAEAARDADRRAQSIDPTVLKALFTCNGGEKVGAEALGQ